MTPKKIINKTAKKKMIRWAKESLKLILIITFFSIAIDAWRSRAMPSENLPSLSINTLEGDWIDIKKISHEKPVLLYFWATWCSVCKIVSPSVNWLSDAHQVISVAIRSGDDQRLRQFMTYKEYDFPVINDATGRISQDWGVTATPTIVIVKNGLISSITTGATTPMGLWLRLYLA